MASDRTVSWVSWAVFALCFSLPIACYKGYTRHLSYYFKFTAMAVTIGLTSTLTLPYMVARGRSSEYPWLPLYIYRLFGRYVIGIEWEFVQTERELRERFFCHQGGGGAVIVVNHQSCLDSFGVVSIWRLVGRLHVVAKKKFQYLGPLGIMGYLAEFTFINRNNTKEAKSQLCNAVIQSQRETKSWTIVFPEGTRNHQPEGRTMLPFKKGAFIAAMEANVPVVPVVFSHYNNLNHQAKRLSPSVNRIQVLQPIYPEGKTVDELLEETRSKMLSAFQST